MNQQTATYIAQGRRAITRDAEEAVRCFRLAHDVDPADPVARRCLALGHVALASQAAGRGDTTAMFDAYDRALDVDPEHPGTHWNLAWELLKQGRLTEGWAHYEWRWRWEGFADRPRGFAQPQWQGEDLGGQTILLHAEQGLGDAIQFARYAPMVAARGGEIVLEVPRRLVRLMTSLVGVRQVVARGDALPGFQCQCPLMSLPHVFGTTVDSIPADVPYLSAPPRPTAPPAIVPGGIRAIGVVWAGSPGHALDERRSIPLDQFLPLMKVEGTRWFSLQKGPGAVALKRLQPGVRLTDLSSADADFADTAAHIARLDLVVSVDTSVAHLAGAMGKPVWILVPAQSDWRWLLNRDDSPWYPTARLFRQTVALDWVPALAAAERALRTSIA